MSAAAASSDARAAPLPLTRKVTSGSSRAAASTSSSDCENPTLPAYSTTGPSPSPSSARYGVARSAGTIASVSTKLGITCTVSAAADLGDDVVAQVVGEHGDGVGGEVAHPLEVPCCGDDRPVRDRTGLDGGVGEDVLDVEHHRAAAQPARDPPGEPERERRRHRDHRTRSAEPPARPQAQEAGEQRVGGEAECPPEEIRLVAAREGVDPGDRSPRRSARCGRGDRPSPARSGAPDTRAAT